jgi:hypothetical protein
VEARIASGRVRFSTLPVKTEVFHNWLWVSVPLHIFSFLMGCQLRNNHMHLPLDFDN